MTCQLSAGRASNFRLHAHMRMIARATGRWCMIDDAYFAGNGPAWLGVFSMIRAHHACLCSYEYEQEFRNYSQAIKPCCVAWRDGIQAANRIEQDPIRTEAHAYSSCCLNI